MKLRKKEKKQTEQNKITMSKIFTKKKKRERERMLVKLLEQNVFPLNASNKVKTKLKSHQETSKNENESEEAKLRKRIKKQNLNSPSLKRRACETWVVSKK